MDMPIAEITPVIIALLLSAMIPHVISYIVIRNLSIGSNKNKFKISKLHLLISVAVNILLLYGFVNILSATGGTIGFIRRFASVKMYYSDISALAVSVLLDCICSFLIPIIAEVIYEKGIEELSVSKRPAGIIAVLFTIALIPAIFGFSFAVKDNTYLEITGVCRKTVVLTEKPNSEDTEEEIQSKYLITNTGVLTVNAKELWLSENIDDLQNARISDVILAPGETYELTLSEDRRLNIKKDGGTVVYLSDVTGTVLSDVTVPAIKTDEWYKKVDGKWQILQNITEKPAAVPVPKFSAEGGFYANEFKLSIAAEDGLKVYYTLDSSIPTSSSKLYKNAIRIYNRSKEPNVYRAIKNVTPDYLENDPTPKEPVDKATVVRAVAVDKAGNVSDVVTKTYFVGLNKYKNGDVVSLVSDPDGLFNSKTGIYVNGEEYEKNYVSKRKILSSEELRKWCRSRESKELTNWGKSNGKEWEREALFELFSAGNSKTKQPVGIRIQGNTARRSALKRFSVYARKEYSGSNFFNDIIVGDGFSHVVYLRGSGSSFPFSQFFCADRNLLSLSYRKVELFLDGEYWGTNYLFDKYDEKNLAERFGLLEDSIVIIKNNEKAENIYDGENLYNNIYHPNIEASTDKEFFTAYNKLVDVQSYIDFVSINHYLNNVDITDINNCLVWHTIFPQNKGYGDGRWYFVSYDMDCILMSDDSDMKAYESNLFTRSSVGASKSIREWSVWSLLKDNTVFQKQFALSYMDMVNTTFSKEFVSYVMNEKGFYSDYRKEFFEKRTEYAVPQVAEELELSGKLGTVTLSSNRKGSPITLNTINPNLKNGTWSGKYFTEYPVTVSANKDGFVRFEVTANGKKTTYTQSTVEIPVTEGGVSIRAIYK